jgi:uncharacterized protein involved in exopolysaccharide biosynthesis
MPIIRRDDTVDPLAGHILYLWQRKWSVILPAAIAAIVTFVALEFVPAEFRVTSEIYVNHLTIGDNETPSNPGAIAKLLESSMVIAQVRDDYTDKFGVKSPPVETFAKQFKVKTDILQDTSVRKDLSPVIELQVQSKGASETQYIMERWIKNFIKDFGNITVQEAVDKTASLQVEDRRLEKEILDTEAELAAANTQLPSIEKNLAESLDLLSQAKLDHTRDDGFPRINQAQTDFNLNFILQNEHSRMGLLQRLNELKLNMATNDALPTAPLEMKALESAIQDARTSVSAAQTALAIAQQKQASTKRNLHLLMDHQTTLRGALNRFAVTAALYHAVDPNAKIPEGADVRALSIPVLPDKKVWPLRSLTAVGVAIAIGILMCIFLFVMRYFDTAINSAALTDGSTQVK